MSLYTTNPTAAAWLEVDRPLLDPRHLVVAQWLGSCAHLVGDGEAEEGRLNQVRTCGLVACRSEGLWYFRSIGVSNFKITDLEAILAIANIKPAVNQVRNP